VARVLHPKQAGGQAADCRAIPAILRSPVATGEDQLAREQRKLAAIIAADVVGYSCGRLNAGVGELDVALSRRSWHVRPLVR
jgi:hypothetical protein